MELVLVMVQSSVVPRRTVWSLRRGSKVRPSMVKLIPMPPMPTAKVSCRCRSKGPFGMGGVGRVAGSGGEAPAGPSTARVARVTGPDAPGGRESPVLGDLGQRVLLQAQGEHS
ncbi:MAG: hypothetical protein ACRDRO_18225 [Pseudonocardiaceae bacterium]